MVSIAGGLTCRMPEDEDSFGGSPALQSLFLHISTKNHSLFLKK
jgi:hypothetical protein